jgi:BlaR1 peptidase M56
VSAAPLVAFNLLVNAVGSFAVAAAIGLVALRALRVPPGRSTLALLSLPFAKIAFDAARGVPEGSFLWARAAGASQDLGAFRFGVGVSWFVPKIDLELSALWHGEHYAQSAADLLASGLMKHVAPWAPAIVAAALAAVSLARVARHARELWRARRERRDVTGGPPHEFRRVGRRAVPLYVVEGLEGSPYVGGWWSPFIVFPARVWGALPDDEREAAIEHELAHVREWHLPWAVAIRLVRDLFWFVPGIGRLYAKFLAAAELAADAGAVERGVEPLTLASALVRAKEALVHGRPRDGVLAAAGGALALRVASLTGESPAPRWPLRARWGRVAFVLWLSATAFIAVACGNH